MKVARYAYTYQGCLVGFSENENVRIAGEINPHGTDWYTPSTPVERCPEGDEIETEYGVKARWELDKEEQQELKEQRDREIADFVNQHNQRARAMGSTRRW